jgi:hypothetical protein
MAKRLLQRALLALAVVSVVATNGLRLSGGDALPAIGRVALAAEYNRACSVTGGSAQQLSAVLSTCGYTGVVSLQELSVKDPDDAANDLYVGQSDVSSANGYKLSPGDSKTWRASNQGDAIDATRFYLSVATTQNVMISLRSK